MADEDTYLDREGDRLSRDRGSSAPPPSREADDLPQAVTNNTASRAAANFLSNQIKIMKLILEITTTKLDIFENLTRLAGKIDAVENAIQETPTDIEKIKALVATAREENEQQLLAIKEMKRAALDLQEAVRQQDFLATVAQLNGFHGMTVSNTNADETRVNNYLASAERLLYDLGKLKQKLNILLRNLKNEDGSDIADGTNGNSAGSQ
ncbi:hypothetical protein T069G_08607 [Trichoderma breve]|uniref:Uncharacterized protein n=1 Tax=Trichoderma breve TaxID=2034170 RepID=A0A9W9B728_9HYPO|nr:hypothetical protein T069G_08607 [Trichoderma breve]KAJ4857710.1 hypothetical protein T069G_08607 [Trichoderma breve]